MLRHFKPRFEDITTKSRATELAFALLARGSDRCLASGSAAAIGPGILITAAHNLSFFRKEFGVKECGSRERTFPGNIYARNNLESKSPALWQVQYCWELQKSDLAVLKVKPASESARRHTTWQIPSISLSPPPIGSRIAAYGYRESLVTFPGDDRTLLNWEHFPTRTIGLIEAIYEIKRDSVMLNFPSFLTSARFEAGMSGGPVFSEAGLLCGIVATGTQALEADTQHTASASSLELLKTFRFSTPNPPLPDWEYTDLDDLVAAEMVFVDEHAN